MLHALILFAQEVKKEAEKGGEPTGIFQNPMFLVLGLMILFFFVVILPAQRKQKREAEALMTGMKKNDEVVTASGIIGVVQTIKDEEVVLKIDDNARIRVLKSSIARIIKKDETPAPPPAPAPTDTNIKPTA
jgi:preprotein translocase subunit YajC